MFHQLGAAAQSTTLLAHRSEVLLHACLCSARSQYMLALAAVWSLRAHLKPARHIDELEPIAFGCVSLGLIMQVVEMSMLAGPRGYVYEVGIKAIAAETASVAANVPRYSNFQPADWHALYHIDEAINKLFKWFDVTNYGLFTVGFACLSIVAAERAEKIFSSLQVKVGYAISAANGICFLLNLLGTTTSALGFLNGWFDTLVKLLIVTWVILLGIGFGAFQLV